MIPFSVYLRRLDGLITERHLNEGNTMLSITDLYNELQVVNRAFADEAWAAVWSPEGSTHATWRYQGDQALCPITRNAVWFNYIQAHWPAVTHPSAQPPSTPLPPHEGHMDNGPAPDSE